MMSVSFCTTNNANIFNWYVINFNWRDSLLVVDQKFVSECREYHEFNFLRGKSNMMFLAVIHSELKAVLEEEDIMGEENDIVRMANGGYIANTSIKSQPAS